MEQPGSSCRENDPPLGARWTIVLAMCTMLWGRARDCLGFVVKRSRLWLRCNEVDFGHIAAPVLLNIMRKRVDTRQILIELFVSYRSSHA